MKIWAHRGCSLLYPENTLLAFEKAMNIKNLTGIELDIQLTSDGYIVVCHDEKIDRTIADGMGRVNSFTLKEIKKKTIKQTNKQTIPTIDEVFDLLENKMKADGLLLNIELKNNVICYENMENKIIDLVYKRGLQDYIVYSSFNAMSVEKIKELDSKAKTGILGTKVSDLLNMIKDGCTADALHPYWECIDLPAEKFKGYDVRAWFKGRLYPAKPDGTIIDLKKLELEGITDVFLNDPEKYL